MVLEMVMESLFAVVNIFWIAKLGADSVASVGLTESVLSVIYALAMGLSIGVTAMVSRRIGEKNQDAAARVDGAGRAARARGGHGARDRRFPLRTAPARPDGGHARGDRRGNRATPASSWAATRLSSCSSSSTRRSAAPATPPSPCGSLWTANAINLLLDPFLIFGWGPFPELGVTGAAVATTIARGIGVL